MAWTVYNKGLYEIGKVDASAADLRGLIIAGASVPAGLTNASAYDINVVSELLAVSGATEAAAAGYARKDLAGVALTEDDANDRAVLSWTDPVWTEVAAGETWRAFVLYRFVTSDSLSPVWGIDVFAAGVPTNGSDVTYTGGSLRISR